MTGLADWSGLDERARRVLLDRLLERLPPWLELVELKAQPRFQDTRSGEGWRLFPGGPVLLGATPERLEAVEAFQRADPMTLFDPTVYLPVREVTVSPFLLMEQVIRSGDEPRIFVMDVMKEQEELLVERGQRLPTEAEWEFSWWAVQSQREHWVPASSELCADGWRPHLAELSGLDPVIPGGPRVLRSASFDSRSLESILPPRQPLSLVRLASVRPALDLPAL